MSLGFIIITEMIDPLLSQECKTYRMGQRLEVLILDVYFNLSNAFDLDIKESSS